MGGGGYNELIQDTSKVICPNLKNCNPYLSTFIYIGLVKKHSQRALGIFYNSECRETSQTQINLFLTMLTEIEITLDSSKNKAQLYHKIHSCVYFTDTVTSDNERCSRFR